METNMTVLNFIYKNSEEGKKTSRELIDISDNVLFIKLLTKLHEGYEKFSRKSEICLKEDYITPESLNVLEKMSSYLMLKIATVADKSSSHIAELLITSSTEGIIQIKNYLQLEKSENPEQTNNINLAEDYLNFEESNIKELTKFL